MAIFKRGKVYWYHFWFNGDHIQESSKQGNPRVARQMEAAHRTALAKGEVGIRDKKPAPTLKQFAQQFLDNAGAGRKQEPKASTKAFYADALNQMLKCEPLASARMDDNLPEVAKKFIRTTKVGPARKNAYLRTLRRAAHVALELGLVRCRPKVSHGARRTRAGIRIEPQPRGNLPRLRSAAPQGRGHPDARNRLVCG
jgi:hypothetical protein